MKRSVFFVLFALCLALCSGQAKKNLTGKKSSLSKGAEVKKEEPVFVYNEDFEKGEELFGLNKPAEAIPFFEKCVEEKDINPDVWIHLGVAYYQTGDFTRSLACCTRGLTKENTNHKILAYNAGNSAYALTNYARAEACYAIAIREDENFAPAYLNRANAQLKQDHLQDAKENYAAYLEKEKDTPQREEIERLIALLSEEIARRANEKPERIDLDFANVRNDEMKVADESEKVNVDLPSEKTAEKPLSERVAFEDSVAPELPVEKKEAVAFSRFAEETVQDEKFAEDKVEVSRVVPDEAVEYKTAEDGIIAEVFTGDEPGEAQYSLPAGTVRIQPSKAGFSPESSDSEYRKIAFRIEASEPSKVTEYIFEIVDENGNVVKTLAGDRLPSVIEWNGLTSGGTVADGRFTSRLKVEYGMAGSVNAESSGFTCYSGRPEVSVSQIGDAFSPDGDGIDDILKLALNVASAVPVGKWKVEIKQNNRVVYEKSDRGTPPEELEWDGKLAGGGTVKSGEELDYSLSATDVYGNTGEDEKFVAVSASRREPVVVKSVEVNKKKDGSVEIQIPTLSFMINSTKLLNNRSNNDVLSRVYEILVDEKYEDYTVTITGYVNPDGEDWTDEETELALNRAKSVEQKLEELGVAAGRMNTKSGSGKTKNKEYNRRVEFNLTK